MNLFDYLELICPIVCFLSCVVHGVVDAVVAHKTNKKIEGLCDKCGMPLYEGLPHECALTDSQLNKLVEFVSSLKEGE